MERACEFTHAVLLKEREHTIVDWSNVTAKPQHGVCVPILRFIIICVVEDVPNDAVNTESRFNHMRNVPFAGDCFSPLQALDMFRKNFDFFPRFQLTHQGEGCLSG